MVKYKKVYLDHFGLTAEDWIGCTYCGGTAVDIHHLLFKSQGGKDVIENLAPVCRGCHNLCHDRKSFNDMIKSIHLGNL